MQQDLHELFVNQYNSLHLNQNLPRSAMRASSISPHRSKKGSCVMRTLIRSSTVSRIAGAVVALWLCGGGVARAGDGQDLGSLQALLSNTSSTGICDVFFPKNVPCPIPSTITQAVLEVAALGNNLAEMIRAQNNIPPGTSINAGNAAAAPPVDAFGGPLPMPFPLYANSNPPLFAAGNAITPPSGLLATLTPLAYASQNSGTAQPVQLYATTADTFLYAVGVSVAGFGDVTPEGLTDPDMVYFFYEDLARTSQNLPIGATVAKFSLPLTVMDSSGVEHPAPATLQFIANNKPNGLSGVIGDCSTSSVVVDLSAIGGSKTTPFTPPSSIGINCAVAFSASPTAAQNHAIFEVAVPLVVAGAPPAKPPACSSSAPPPVPCSPNTDPLYFFTLNNSGPPAKKNPVNNGGGSLGGVYTAFTFNEPGTPLTSGSIGLAPSAAPLTQPSSGAPNYALCAVLPSNGNGLSLRPSVGAFYAMATSGEMLLSAPLPSAFTSSLGGTPPQCPQL
jgi:hypothetical protein